ncbi:MAG: hypothetical protein ACQEQ4_02845 [Fibrobacterota bacterium]
MSSVYIIIGLILTAMTILFLVISRVLNSTISYLARIEFLLNTEYEFRRDEMEVSKILMDSLKEEDLEDELENTSIDTDTTPESNT